MVYDYYFKTVHLPSLPESGTSSNQFEDIKNTPTMILKRFFNHLHYSSRVRAETAPKIYKACFTNVWFSCDLPGRSNDLDRVKEMCSLLRDVNKDIKFSLRSNVHGHDDATFAQFVDSVLGLQVEGEDGVRLEYVLPAEDIRLTEHFLRRERSRRTQRFHPIVHWEQQMSTMSKSGDCYTHWRSGTESHELWMFGALARLDWSEFDWHVQIPTTRRETAKEQDVPFGGFLPEERPSSVVTESRAGIDGKNGLDVESEDGVD